jgi:hypothetical protein
MDPSENPENDDSLGGVTPWVGVSKRAYVKSNG